MATNPYSEKFRDPRWQRKRLEIMGRDQFRCLDCDRDDQTLNVHHRYYVKGRDPWEYPDWCLQTLCEPCHGKHHDRVDESPIQEWEHLVQHIMPVGQGIEEWDLHTTLGIALKQGFDKNDCFGTMIYALVRLVESKAPDIDWKTENTTPKK